MPEAGARASGHVHVYVNAIVDFSSTNSTTLHTSNGYFWNCVHAAQHGTSIGCQIVLLYSDYYSHCSIYIEPAYMAMYISHSCMVSPVFIHTYTCIHALLFMTV